MIGLRNDIANEIKLHSKLCEVSGSLDLLLKTSVIAQRDQDARKKEPVFGDVLITPVLFSPTKELMA